MNLSKWWRRDEVSAEQWKKDEAAELHELEIVRVAKRKELSEQNERDAALWDERVEAMPDYTPRPSCVKCGDSGIAVTFKRPVFSAYEAGYSSVFHIRPSYSGDPAPARHGALNHKCEHCGYAWSTKAADHASLQKNGSQGE